MVMVTVLIRKMEVAPMVMAKRDPPLWGAWIKYDVLQEVMGAELPPATQVSEMAVTDCESPQNCA
jgi:hypothetical protein